ncbi:embryogenesis-associated protein EMB8 [Carex littledalei]|uniref:Embryogenesis-associated protein EMB8 n=1 Tax=Carex littledalei TaxID=544730 RepID=A0A833R1X8_9POAL|nr:embryogenesis-associated protein EMB8 [Carex littledalei]
MSNDTISATFDASAYAAGELLLRVATSLPPLYYLIASILVVVVFLYNFLECHLLSDIFHGFFGDPVELTFNPNSDIYHGVASKCRSLHGRYLVTPWLASPHLQTVFLNFFGRPPSFKYNRQIYRTRDGGTIALDWLLFSDVAGGSSQVPTGISKEDSAPLMVMVPGLTSDSASPYVKHMVYKMAKNGWNVVVGNHRGLGGMSITSDCFYNAGWTEDTRELINYLHKEYPNAPMYAVGTSIGANILVKYLGEEGENTPLAGAAAVCSPWDLVVCDRFIHRKLAQRLYGRALTIGLQGYAELHQHVLSRLANWEGIIKSRSVRDFDNHATRIVAKYETVDTYYRRCSSVSYVANVSVPLLCISAIDDPVCTSEAIPWDECRANKKIVLATTTHGGHLGFFQGLTAKRLWWVGAVYEFLSVLHNSPFMHCQKKVEAVGLHSSLESAIDHSPYVNITEDGMLAPATKNILTENTVSPTIKEITESEITSE